MSIEKIIVKSAKKIGQNMLSEMAEGVAQQLGSSDEKIPPPNKNIEKEYAKISSKNSELCSNIDNGVSKQPDEIAVINAHGRNMRLNIMIIGAAIGLGLCLIILTICTGKLSGEVIGIVSTVAGIFGACLKDAYSFEFGSSRGSREKDERISATILEKLRK